MMICRNIITPIVLPVMLPLLTHSRGTSADVREGPPAVAAAAAAAATAEHQAAATGSRPVAAARGPRTCRPAAEPFLALASEWRRAPRRVDSHRHRSYRLMILKVWHLTRNQPANVHPST